jgi:serine/threonine protein kinase
MKNLTGLTINQYHIMQQLGHGGMAAVYKAYDTRQDRDVAIKMIRVDEVPSEFLSQVQSRFKTEAEIQTRFQHPNIVTVYEYGNFENIPYLVMEYLPGGTLKQRMQRALSLRSAVRILSPIADALGYAHSLGVIHRDIKPSNILFNNQRMPMLTDFGTARVLEAGNEAPGGLGVGVGTPAYMAPEQWRGIAVPQTDIYALGVVMFEILTGTRPYSADTPIAVALKQAGEPIPNPRLLVNGLPIQAEHFLYRAMAKDVNNRFGSMAEMRVALEKLAQIEPVEEQKVATVMYATREDVGIVQRPTLPQASYKTQGQPGNERWEQKQARIASEIPGATEDEDVIGSLPEDEKVSPANTTISSWAADLPVPLTPNHPDELRSSIIPPQPTPSQDGEDPVPGETPTAARQVSRTKPHARPIPITDSDQAVRVAASSKGKAPQTMGGKGLTWWHVLLLAVSWGIANLIKGLVTVGLTTPVGFELALTLGTAFAWLIGGMVIGWVFHKAIKLDGTLASLVPPTFGFISGLSVLTGFIINSEGGWVISNALLWGLIGLMTGLVFYKPGKLGGKGIGLLAIGWAIAGALSALFSAIKLDEALTNLLGRGFGHLFFGGLEGLVLGTIMGLVTGLVFVKPLARGWWKVILLILLWGLGMALGHSIYEFLANGIQANPAFTSGLSWMIRIFFIFFTVKLLFQTRSSGH